MDRPELEPPHLLDEAPHLLDEAPHLLDEAPQLLDEHRLAALDDRIGVLAAQIHSLSVELAASWEEFLTGGGLNGAQFSSPAQWLSVRTKFPVAEARRITSVAERLDDLPTLTEAAREGRVSLGVVANAARVTTADNEADVARIARAATPSQSARILATYRSLRHEDDDAAPLPPEPSSWWRCWYDDDGRGRIDAALDPATAALLERAWAAARASDEAHDAADAAEPGRRPSADDTAARLARTMLDHADDAGLRGPGREHFSVQVTVDVATLARVLGLHHDPTATIGIGSRCFVGGTGRHLTDRELAEVLCDASLHVLVHDDGVPLWMGNEVRSATRHQRRALTFRSGGGCEFPGCTRTRHLHVHHVEHHGQGGRTSLENLVLLCGHHHRELHRRGWTISTRGDQRFTFWNGRECLGSTCTPQSPGGRPPDLQLRPDGPAPPPPDLPGSATCSETGGERLTPYALDVYLSNLLAA